MRIEKCHQIAANVFWRAKLSISAVQLSLVTQSCPILCDPLDCSTPGLPVHHQLPVYPNSCLLSWWCHPTISSSVISSSPCLQSFSGSGSFPMSQFFPSGGQSIGVSAFNISPSNEHPGLISFKMDRLDLLAVQGTQESSPTPQFKSINSGIQLSLSTNSHIHTWLLEKP